MHNLSFLSSFFGLTHMYSFIFLIPQLLNPDQTHLSTRRSQSCKHKWHPFSMNMRHPLTFSLPFSPSKKLTILAIWNLNLFNSFPPPKIKKEQIKRKYWNQHNLFPFLPVFFWLCARIFHFSFLCSVRYRFDETLFIFPIRLSQFTLFLCFSP